MLFSIKILVPVDPNGVDEFVEGFSVDGVMYKLRRSSEFVAELLTDKLFRRESFIDKLLRRDRRLQS